MPKKDLQTPTPAPTIPTNSTSAIPVLALVLGVTSLTTFMWFLGIPAIILGIIGMRRYGENRGLSIAGLITGIISTLLMIGAFLLFTVFFIVTILNSDSQGYENSTSTPYSEQDSRENGERYYREYREGM